MKGFNPQFKNFPDYIIRMTKELWEDRNIAKLHEYYAKDIIVRLPSAIVLGNENVIHATLATLAEFPDRTLLGEDVIWCGNPELGMLSSHRILSTATHLGNGVYGKASGKKLVYRIIADCHAIQNQINDEWLIRDQGAVVRQMGIKPEVYAQQLIEQEGGAEHCVHPFTPKLDKTGPYQGTGNDNKWGVQYAEILTRIMNADMAVIPTEFDRACQLEYPGGKTVHGHPEADKFWMGLRAAFPDADFKIEHQMGIKGALMPPRAAIRWSLHGTHKGFGAFGAPTGAMVYVMGISHAEFGPWGLRREYVLFDETAIWKQIYIQK